MVYARGPDHATGGESLTFGVSGFLLRDALVMFDHQTESLWSQFIGAAIDGPLAGSTLELLPSRITSWADWRRGTPDGTAMDKSGMGTFPSLSFVFDVEAAELVGEPTAEGLSSHDLVLGVSVGDEHVAFAMKHLVARGVLNVEVGGVPLLLTAETGLYTGAAYQRTLAEHVLTFEVGPEGAFVDTETGSTWDVTSGVALTGPHAGKSLARVDARQSFWFAWRAYHPTTELR